VVLERSSTNETGYKDVNTKKTASGKVGYYAKTRLDLNKKDQTRLPGELFNTPLECAIYLATYLKEHPPAPRVSGKVRSCHPLFCIAFAWLTPLINSRLRQKRKKKEGDDLEEQVMCELAAGRPAWVVDANTWNLWELGMDESQMPKEIVSSARRRMRKSTACASGRQA